MVASFDLFKPVDSDLDRFEELDLGEANFRDGQASLGPVKRPERSLKLIKLSDPTSFSEQSEALDQNQTTHNKALSSPFDFGYGPLDKKDSGFSPQLRAFDSASIQSKPSLRETGSELEDNSLTNSAAPLSIANSGWIGGGGSDVSAQSTQFTCSCPQCCDTGAPRFDHLVNRDLANFGVEAAQSDIKTNVPKTGDIRIDSLIYSYKWTTPKITYSFFDGGSYYGSERGVKEEADWVN